MNLLPNIFSRQPDECFLTNDLYNGAPFIDDKFQVEAEIYDLNGCARHLKVPHQGSIIFS